MAKSLMSDYESAMASARAANEARYQQGMAGWDTVAKLQGDQIKNIKGAYQLMLDEAAGVGESQRLDLQDQYARQLGRTNASMYARGLGNSTLRDSANRGVSRDLARSKIQLSDALSRERTGIRERGVGMADQAFNRYTGALGQKLDYMERRTDAYPNLGDYLRMAQMEGMGSVGGGGAGGGFTVGGFGAGPRGGGGMPQGGGSPRPFIPPIPQASHPWDAYGSQMINYQNQYNNAAAAYNNQGLYGAVTGFAGGMGGGYGEGGGAWDDYGYGEGGGDWGGGMGSGGGDW